MVLECLYYGEHLLAVIGYARYCVSVFPKLLIDPVKGVLFERDLIVTKARW